MLFELLSHRLDNSNLTTLEQTQTFITGIAKLLVEKNILTEREIVNEVSKIANLLDLN